MNMKGKMDIHQLAEQSNCDESHILSLVRSERLVARLGTDGTAYFSTDVLAEDTTKQLVHCEECMYWRISGQSDTCYTVSAGDCVRHTPAAARMSNNRSINSRMFPRTGNMDCCGEGRLRPFPKSDKVDDVADPTTGATKE